MTCERDRSIDRMRQHLFAHPEDLSAYRAFADALKEEGDQLGEYIVSCIDGDGWVQPPIPLEAHDSLFGALHALDADFGIDTGFVRRVELNSTPDWEDEVTQLAMRDIRWQGVVELHLPSTRLRDTPRWLELLTRAPRLANVCNVRFGLFTALCEQERHFNFVRLLDRPTPRLLSPIAAARLRVDELVAPGAFDDGSALQWLLTAARPVFESIRWLSVPDVDADDAERLLYSASPALDRVRGRHWVATRDPSGSVFNVTLQPSRERGATRATIRPPAWAPPLDGRIERTRRGAVLPVTLAVPVPPSAAAEPRMACAVPAEVSIDDGSCPFANETWRYVVTSLTTLSGVTGLIERLDSGVWMLTLEGPGIRDLVRPLPLLIRDWTMFWAILPSCFELAVREDEAPYDDVPPTTQTLGASALDLRAHAWLRIDPEEAQLQLSVYPTESAWVNAAPEGRSLPIAGTVVTRSTLGVFIGMLSVREPIYENAELALARRLLERAEARADAARECPPPYDIPF